MTIRLPVSPLQNHWNDAQRVDRTDMNLEQDFNNSTNAAIVNNHLGSGIVPNAIEQRILFDSNSLTEEQAAILSAGDFDGTGLDFHLQPSDTNLGVQLEIELTDSTVFGRQSVKVFIVGLDFESNLQYDTFNFHKNEKQVTRKHYTSLLTVFFNDFKGNNSCSREFGGSVVIREANSYQLSRDCKMIAQDIEPNLFFRDFKTAGNIIVPNVTVTLYSAIQEAIGSEYSVDALDINTTWANIRRLAASDVSSKVGQKFIAKTNNIQKITLLLGAEADNSVDIADKFDWTGQLVISLYKLQTTVECPTDIVPELAIEFEPEANPIVQLSFSQADLRSLGYVLTDVAQPIDFVFSNTAIGSSANPVINPDHYYAVIINRSGAAGTGAIFTLTGRDRTEDSRLTLYGSGSWVDVNEEDVWFQIWTDAAKVADGQAYDAGNGMQIDKTVENELGAEEDYCLCDRSFSSTGENTLNIGVVQAVQAQSVTEQDERTGNTVYARQNFEPSFSFVTEAGLEALSDTTEPLIIGCGLDTNPKDNALIDGVQAYPGLVIADEFTIIEPDPDLLSFNLIGSKLIPNMGCVSKEYRIFEVLTCIDGYGDVNGDGYIDASDIARVAELLGHGLASSDTQQDIIDGYISTLELLRADVDGDGYVTANDVTLITEYVARSINGFPVGSTFTHMVLKVQQSIGRWDGYFDCSDGYVRLDGYAGINLVLAEDLDPSELEYDGYLTDVSMNGDDAAFTTVPYSAVTYQIIPQSFWHEYLVNFSSAARLVPASFTYTEGITVNNCDPTAIYECQNRAEILPECDPGRNDFMVPDNLIIRRGQILGPDGGHHKIDLEIGQVILELPEFPLEESSLNVFMKLVADVGDGKTAAGFNAMKFADCSTVGVDAIERNQVRFDVSIQAFVPNIDGYGEDGYGIIVDDIIGVYMNHAAGILTLSIRDLSVDPIYRTMVTKLQITVYLKKAGWNNRVLVVDSDQVAGLLS